MTRYRVIYLAAGIGERLRPHTYDLHKCMLKIGEKSIVEHWLDSLIYSGAEVDAVYVVIGHYGYKFRKLLGSSYRGLKIKFFVNPLFKVTGGGQSVYVARRIMSGSSIILDGDHYMDPELMKILMESEFENCILVDGDLSKIEFDEETLAYGYRGLLYHLRWLPPYPENPVGEAITIYKLSKAATIDLRGVLERHLLEDGPAKRELIEPFNRLMRQHDVHYVETEGQEWTEIDFEEDLERAREMRF